MARDTGRATGLGEEATVRACAAIGGLRLTLRLSFAAPTATFPIGCDRVAGV